MENIHEIVVENARRNALINLEYCPVRGIGCTGERVECYSPVSKGKEFIPKTMYDSDKFHMVKENAQAWRRLRICHDFEYWAATCCTIKDKRTGCDVFMRLNRPQRRVLAIMEQQRMAGEPVRLIMLKARQWGGSTLVQVYMAWIQLVHKRSWNSLICAHVKDTAATIRGMYSKILSDYPADVWDEDGVCRPEFRVYERSTNIRYIPGRDCRVTLGSAEKQDSVRGGDFAMAHLSEVAFWGDTTRHSPEGFVRAICGSIMREPFTLIVMESTANGTGNFFHAEWLRACSAEGSDKIPVFVPWYEIELYSKPVGDVEALWSSLDSYERGLWHKYGCTLEQIAWYREKRREYPTRQLMAAEYPTDDVEAFANTGSSVFPAECVAELAKGCMLPLCLSCFAIVTTCGFVVSCRKLPTTGAEPFLYGSSQIRGPKITVTGMLWLLMLAVVRIKAIIRLYWCLIHPLVEVCPKWLRSGEAIATTIYLQSVRHLWAGGMARHCLLLSRIRLNLPVLTERPACRCLQNWQRTTQICTTASVTTASIRLTCPAYAWGFIQTGQQSLLLLLTLLPWLGRVPMWSVMPE